MQRRLERGKGFQGGLGKDKGLDDEVQREAKTRKVARTIFFR